MFRRWSNAQDRSEPAPPSKSPPSSPVGRVHPFYQHPSGSRFMEDAVSAVLSSETASDVTSVGVSSIQTVPSWRGLRMQTSPKKLRRALPQAPRSTMPPVPAAPANAFVGEGSSEITSLSWTTRSTPTVSPPVPPAPAPAPEPALVPSKHSISFCPVPHPAESFTEDDRLKVRWDESPPLVFLRAVAPKKSQHCRELLHTSLPSDRDAMRDIMPRKNGLVDTVIEAYNNHRGLVIRPDDVWLAIMTQFSFFVNGHSETLRKVFVSHEGKRDLVVESRANRYTMQTASMVHQMVGLMEAQLADPSLRDWIMPDFTTTTQTDKTVCAIVMMGVMKEYFSYKFCLSCGIPKVTLEGEKKDWQTILQRLEHLKRYGIQTIAWYHLLRPVVSRFVAAYDDPARQDNLDFWNKVAHWELLASGPQWLSGWITAFCVFDERGRWQGNKLNEERVREHEPKKLLRPADPLHLTPSHFAAVYTIRERGAPYLALDGFPYPTIDGQDVPCGYSCVDVKLDDNGTSMDTMFIAGSVGAQICSTEKTELFRNGMRDTVRPVSAWWYFVKQKVVRMEDSNESDSDG